MTARYDDSNAGNASPAGDCEPLASEPDEPDCEPCPDASGGVAADEIVGDIRCGLLDFVTTVRAVRPLKIEGSSKCSLSSV